MSELEKLPPELRKALAGSLLRSLGAGPIEPEGPGDDGFRVTALGAEDGIEVVPDKAEDAEKAAFMGGFMSHMIERAMKAKEKTRAATPAEVAAFNMAERAPFKVGDAVRWRAGYALGRFPAEGESAIVSQVIAPPVYNTGSTGSAQGAERNDIALAYVSEGEGGAFVQEFLFDSRRFERVPDEDSTA